MAARTGPVLLAVIGHPIAHSLSPAIHTAAIKELGLDASYIAIDVPPERLQASLLALQTLGFRGLNLTIPHKEQAFSCITECTDAAHRSGAVNTLLFDGERIVGDSTDGRGYLLSLQEELGVDAAGMRVAVLGAGGAARGIVDALLAGGAEHVTIYNRDLVRAAKLAAQMGTWHGEKRLAAAELQNAQMDGVDLLVQTTSVGMSGHQEGQLPIAATCLHERLIVSDIVYRPLDTPLLLAARAVGARTHGGLGMLLYQGAFAFEQWLGVFPPVAVMRAAALSML